MQLNLGCGNDYIEGWINVDKRSDVKTDICCDLLELYRYVGEESVDRIQATNVLEHVGWQEVKSVLKIIYNILKVGGQLSVRGPDIRRAAEKYLQGFISEELFIEVVYGKEDYEENTHKSGWSEEGLEKILSETGFKDVEVAWRDESWGFELRVRK